MSLAAGLAATAPSHALTFEIKQRERGTMKDMSTSETRSGSPPPERGAPTVEPTATAQRIAGELAQISELWRRQMNVTQLSPRVTVWPLRIFTRRQLAERTALRELTQELGLHVERLREALASELGEIPAVIRVSAEEYDGMRRHFESPEPEQVARLEEFLAKTPSPRRA